MAGYNGPLDMKRPLMYCTVPGYPNFRVFMYLDAPGDYITENGDPVPEKTAKSAGFPVEHFRKQKLFAQEREKFEAAMRDQLQMETSSEVYAEDGGLRVIHFPETGNAVLERDGKRIYPTPVPLSLAVVLFQEFVQDAKVRAEEVKAEPGIANSTEAAPSPPPTSAPASDPRASDPRVGKKAMLT